MRKPPIDSPKAAKLHKRNEDYREVTFWCNGSFKEPAKRQNRRDRRRTREALRASGN